MAAHPAERGLDLWLVTHSEYADPQSGFLGDDLTVFPHVDACAVHTGHLAGLLGRAAQGTADHGGECRWLVRLFSRLHGPSSNKRGVAPELS